MGRWANFLRGMGSVLCIFPHREPTKRMTDEEIQRAAWEDIGKDWQAVGDDMRKVMGDMDKITDMDDAMRENYPDWIGSVAVCGKGMLGVIEGQKELKWGLSWVGRKLEDGSPWASRNPKIVAASLEEYSEEDKADKEETAEWFSAASKRALRRWAKENPY